MKLSLDNLEIESLKVRMDELRTEYYRLDPSNLRRGTINIEIDNAQKRFHELNGKYYTFRHSHEYEVA